MFTISKKFEFCYGHRVYTQDCISKYSIDNDNPCQRIHGHQGCVTVEVETESLDRRGFVIDFKELSFVKKFINDNLDHRFILSYDDPGFEQLSGYSPEHIQQTSNNITLLDSVIMGYMNSDVVNDSFMFVDFNPTSENLAKWIFDAVDKVIEDSPFECNVKSVTWSETPKTNAIYTGTN